MYSSTKENVQRIGRCEDDKMETPKHDPSISLPVVVVRTNEEDEVELVKLHATLYRYDMIFYNEWKERGTGEIKLLKHKFKNTVRVVMRRDKTFKVCANHFINPDMTMNFHGGSTNTFIWPVYNDYADELSKQEILAIKFENPQDAELWQTKFAEAQEIVRTNECSEKEILDEKKRIILKY